MHHSNNRSTWGITNVRIIRPTHSRGCSSLLGEHYNYYSCQGWKECKWENILTFDEVCKLRDLIMEDKSKAFHWLLPWHLLSMCVGNRIGDGRNSMGWWFCWKQIGWSCQDCHNKWWGICSAHLWNYLDKFIVYTSTCADVVEDDVLQNANCQESMQERNNQGTRGSTPVRRVALQVPWVELLVRAELHFMSYTNWSTRSVLVYRLLQWIQSYWYCEMQSMMVVLVVQIEDSM